MTALLSLIGCALTVGVTLRTGATTYALTGSRGRAIAHAVIAGYSVGLIVFVITEALA